MSFEKFTTCPVCGCHTPLIWRKQDGKCFKEMRSCPIHGIQYWQVNDRTGSRKLLSISKEVPREKLAPKGSFADRCDAWQDLKSQGCNSRMIRRIPPRRREAPYKK